MQEFKRERKDYKAVGKCMPKKDSQALLLGKAVYMDDITPQDCLVIKILRSPHANAIVQEVNAVAAMKIPGMTAVFTWKDVPKTRFAIAGQTYPEPSPYDRLILDQHVRSVGDAVAIVVGENEKAVNKALKVIKVKYQVLEPLLDFHKAIDNPVVVHPEDDWEGHDPSGQPKRNLLYHEEQINGDVEALLADCGERVETTCKVQAAQQGYMETVRAYCEIDRYGRLHCISSTQIVFHVRRILSHALGIPKSMIRAEKPRIGGGFGAKQTAVCEVYPAFVTWTLKQPSKLIYTREECQTIASPRHEMEVTVRLGAEKDGRLRAIGLYTLSNTGAYGEHGTTTVGLSGTKALPLYTGGCEATRFVCDVVYTNVQAAGAYRGYGATQGIFALESAVNMMADKIGMDPVEFRLKNIVREGMYMPAYYGETAGGCALDRCIMHCAENFHWKEKYPVRDMGKGKVRSAGMAIAMQGSCISNCDVGSCTIKLGDSGTYNMLIGAADMGTGCDTILAQMAAEVLECEVDDIAVFGADTDASPYDSGSYASSTTYITGTAVMKACLQLRENICKIGAALLNTDPEKVDFDGKFVYSLETEDKVSLDAISAKSQVNNTIPVDTTATYSSPVSPPPYMCGMVEIELDKETGSVEILDYQAVVDCGLPVNPNLARVQTEGGIGQGIGMTLYENVHYSKTGHIAEKDFMQYKIPTRLDMKNINVEFETSYEPTGPFGVKSIGEIVINTPAPALAHAIYRATGVWHHNLPITPEKILMSMEDPDWKAVDRRME